MLRIRSAALLQVVIFSCAMLTAWSHKAHARHGYCTEHGALIHAKELPASHETSPGGPVVKESCHQHGAHDCAVLAFLANGVSAPEQINADELQELTAALTPPRVAGPAGSIPLLLQAPKASPPPV
jgi:hypothetical protein